MPFESIRSLVRFRLPEASLTQRRLGRCANVEDLRQTAWRRLPGGVFDYIDGGAEAESSLERNSSAFANITLHPNVLEDVADIDISTTLLGTRRPTPLLLAPTGFTRIAHPDGELAVARAAGRRGVPYALSTLGTRSIEELAAAASGPLWFQVYVWKDKAVVADMLARAEAAGYEAIVVTVDTAVLGRRERDVRRGFTLPPKLGLETIVDGALRPKWTFDLIRNEPITFANVAGMSGIDGTTAVALSEYINAQFDPSLSWQSIDDIRQATDLKIVLKGIQRIDDARRAAAHGADAIVLSNHGGRQVDGTPAPIDLVADATDAVGDKVDVICDGGIRRGSDIVKACALGADAVMLGRPYLYGLAAGGEAGVDWVLENLIEGVERTMALCGRTSLSHLDRDLVGRL